MICGVVGVAGVAHAKPDDKLTQHDARHLLNRTGFAAAMTDIDAMMGLSRKQAADQLLAGTRDVAMTPPPVWVTIPITPASKLRDMTPEERQAEQRLNNERAIDLREWWFREMLNTPSPLTEKMTLFWHNHFATSQQKVRYSSLMYQQHVLLRKQALGNFGSMLRQVARDPAMLIYLDNATSRREQPNENFAREVMELFTLGEGNYSEQDIKEMARAFTGWSLDRETGEFLFRRGIHDAGVKTIFGQRGNFEGEQALDLILKRPETAVFITRKLWREFVSSTPDEAEVAKLATVFRDSGYNIAKLMQAMLVSDAFYAAENRGSLVKSPVEFVVGTLKLFDITTPNLRPFVFASAQLGQNLFSPPNVKGWPGGEVWINSATLLGRKQFVDRLFRNEDRMEPVMNALDEMADRSGTPSPPGRAQRQQRIAERAMAALNWNLEGWSSNFNQPNAKDNLANMSKVVLAVAPRQLPVGGRPADWARTFVSDPAYQLK
ncbi:MAG: DUF1800 domain-containing protein [Aeromicrobium sp.]|nr:DUF1800 domain-containing protein [Burkholderiales bacterium]